MPKKGTPYGILQLEWGIMLIKDNNEETNIDQQNNNQRVYKYWKTSNAKWKDSEMSQRDLKRIV